MVKNLTNLRQRRRSEESGIALITVVAFMIMAALVTAVLLTVTLANITTTANQRAGVGAQAASDAGIERVVAWLDGVSDVNNTGVKVKRTYASIINGDLPPYTVVTIGEFEVELTYRYRVINNYKLEERDVLGPNDNPVALIVTSVARPAAGNWKHPSMSQRATVAEISLIRTNPGFDKALFSGGSATLQITNDMQLLPSDEAAANGEADAHVYSNGAVHCMTQIPVGGTIYAQGPITMDNNCKTLSTLWSGGGVSLADGVRISGDVYAAGAISGQPTKSVQWSNNAGVLGNVIGKFDVDLGQGHPQMDCGPSGKSNVCKSVISYEGSVLASQSPRVGENVVAKNSVRFNGSYNSALAIGGYAIGITGDVISAENNANNGAYVGQYIRANGITQIHPNQLNAKNADGNSCQNGATVLTANCSGQLLQFPSTLTPTGYPDNAFPDGLFNTTIGAGGAIVPNFQTGINAPPREEMPRIVGPQVGASVDPNEAQTYDPWDGWHLIEADCTTAERILSPRGTGTTYQNRTVVIANNCDRALKWDQNDDFKITGDLAIISPNGFEVSNGGSISFTATNDPDLFWIVPADIKQANGTEIWQPGTLPPGQSCTRNIQVSGGLGIGTADFGWLMYTPCYINIQNQWNGTFKGQFYGGAVTVPQNSKIQMELVPVPSEPDLPDPSDEIDAVISGRYNIPVPQPTP